MIAKERDASELRIRHLENMNTGHMDTVGRMGVHQSVARLRADSTTHSACEFINENFAQSPIWAVLHDLRLVHNKRIVHINHLLINSSMEFYCLDTRFINDGIVIDEHGTCCLQLGKIQKLVSSPLSKLNRDIRFLKNFLKQNNILPRCFGISKNATIKGYVVTSSSLRIDRPPTKLLDTSQVIPADSLFPLIWQEPASWINKHGKLDSKELLRETANRLISLHKPTVALESGAVKPRIEPILFQSDLSHCGKCGSPVCSEVREESMRNMRIFSNRILCINCQKIVLDKAVATN